MKLYKRILLAIDLHPGCDATAVKKALSFAKENDATLHVIHVIEHIPAYSLGQAYPSIIDLEEEILKDATKELRKFGHRHEIPEENLIVTMGSPKALIIEKAEELKINLIIVGSHGRHGFALIMGSTASAILAHAPCDVLAVRIQDKA